MMKQWKFYHTEYFDKPIENKPQAKRSDGEYKFEFYCLTTDFLYVKQAYSGKGFAAKDTNWL